MEDYQQFLSAKNARYEWEGISDAAMPDCMFDYQKAITRWALRKGRAAIFADCGLGKTLMQLVWCRAVHFHTNTPALIVAPLAVCEQTKREAQRFGIDTECFHIINYEKLHTINPADYAGVVLDECFPPETPIDVFNIDGQLIKKHIKDIRRGDKIFNAAGEDYVQSIYKRKINRAVQISINGRNITCSENHPFFTLHGWRCAQDLRAGDCIMATGAAMRLVRGDIQTLFCSAEDAAFLRSILLSEMADEYTGASGEGSHKGSGCPSRSIESQVVEEWVAGSVASDGENKNAQSHEQPGNAGESIIDIASDEAQTFRAWGQWSSDDVAAAHNEGCTVMELDTGISYITGKTSTRFSDMLQSRLRQSRCENSDRDRWIEPSQPQAAGYEKRQQAGFFRVESIEILESGHPELEKYRDADGVIYFYDIKATRHPSFSIHGCLVHNSSIIKSFTGRIRNQLIELFKHTPYKLACTATPSPNDYMELGNHAEFLGVMTYTEMLAMYFIHDGGETSKWRLKGHGQQIFWEWLCSWAVFVRQPSDLGFDGDNFVLPPLNEIKHCIPDDSVPSDTLIPLAVQGLSERIALRRDTVGIRMRKVAELARDMTEPVIIWCDLNAEADAIKELLPEAVEIRGNDKDTVKAKGILDFADGNIPILITKGEIAGFGCNFQATHNMIFAAVNDSYESYYQCIRRQWRYGQTQPVNVHLVYTERQQTIIENLARKHKQMETMAMEMAQATNKLSQAELCGGKAQGKEYAPQLKMIIPG